MPTSPGRPTDWSLNPGSLGTSATSDANRLSAHPLVAIVWIAAALAIAGGVGPWLSHYVGIVLPAFAMVRTSNGPKRN